jgi:hypothetical protein
MTIPGYPTKQGLYDPRFEHDACGIGFVVNIKGEQSHEIVDRVTVLRISTNGVRVRTILVTGLVSCCKSRMPFCSMPVTGLACSCHGQASTG